MKSYSSRISIHVPREGHDYARDWANRMFLISIHVPREGHDTVLLAKSKNPPISIHVPREGHDRRFMRG